jgi:glutaredoxin-like YruB-family protein
MSNVSGLTGLLELIGNEKRAFIFIYKSGSEQSDCALARITSLEKASNSTVIRVDVNEVKDIHPHFGITSVPALLELSYGKTVNIYKGCQTEAFYDSVLGGKKFARIPGGDDAKPVKRVTVYTTPTCTWCTTIKTYLKEKNIRFTEVDVASNPARAEEMVKKSGQQGVPQTDINGQVVVVFDKNRINQLLEIQ